MVSEVKRKKIVTEQNQRQWLLLWWTLNFLRKGCKPSQAIRVAQAQVTLLAIDMKVFWKRVDDNLPPPIPKLSR